VARVVWAGWEATSGLGRDEAGGLQARDCRGRRVEEEDLAIYSWCVCLGRDTSAEGGSLGCETVAVRFLLLVVILILGHRQQYRKLKDEWWGVPEVFERQDVLEVSRCEIITRMHQFNVRRRNDIE
jgi:hypothetical protein